MSEEMRIITEIKMKHNYIQHQLESFENNDLSCSEFGLLLDEVTGYISTLNQLNVEENQTKDEKNKTLDQLKFQQSCLYNKFEEKMLNSFKSYVVNSGNGQHDKLATFLNEVNQHLDNIENIQLNDKQNIEWHQRCVLWLKFIKEHYEFEYNIINTDAKVNTFKL